MSSCKYFDATYLLVTLCFSEVFFMGKEKTCHLVVLRKPIETHSERQSIIFCVIYSHKGRAM